MTTSVPSPHALKTDGPRLLAGVHGHYTLATRGDIPALWQSFVPYLDDMPYQAGSGLYHLWRLL